MGCKFGSVAEVLTAVTLPVAARPGPREPQEEATQAGNLGKLVYRFQVHLYRGIVLGRSA